MLKILLTIWIFYFKVIEGKITYKIDVFGEDQHGYYITVKLGTPPQNVNLLIDTGSSNIALAVVPTISDESNYFHYNESQTLHQLDIAVDLRYIVGQWNGFLAKDIIHLDDSSLEVTIACMVSISQIFDVNSQFQGLLGLAYPSIAIPDASVEPFFDKLIQMQDVSNIFCINLCGPYFTSQEQTTSCGKFYIGTIPTEFNAADIVYTPVIKDWYYEVLLSGLKIGKNQAPFSCKEINKDRTVVDSGTTELYLPVNVYHWAVNDVKNSVIHVIPDKYWINETVACVQTEKFNLTAFPFISLSLYHTFNSTFNLIISPDQYLLTVKSQKSSMVCFKLAFSVSDGGTLIGSSILKGFLVVFDRENKRIGFGNTKEHNQTSGIGGSVTKPKYTNQLMQWCKYEEHKSGSEVTPIMIVLLCTAVIFSVILLYMLVSWIFRQFFNNFDDSSSETSSLVDGIVLETLR